MVLTPTEKQLTEKLLSGDFMKAATPDEVAALIHKGADVHAVDGHGQTALSFAVSNNPNPEIIKILLANGADINAANKDGNTALMYAARRNSNPDVVEILLANSADVNVNILLRIIELNNALKGSAIHEKIRELVK